MLETNGTNNKKRRIVFYPRRRLRSIRENKKTRTTSNVCPHPPNFPFPRMMPDETAESTLKHSTERNWNRLLSLRFSPTARCLLDGTRIGFLLLATENCVIVVEWEDALGLFQRASRPRENRIRRKPAFVCTVLGRHRRSGRWRLGKFDSCESFQKKRGEFALKRGDQS